MKKSGLVVFETNSAKYSVLAELGKGGNGTVYKVQSNNKLYALKKLRSGATRKAIARFKREIDTILNNHDIDGIMPHIDHNLPSKNSIKSGKHAFYVMPYGIPSIEYTKNMTPNDIIKIISPLAKTLSSLESRKYAHRDIKPENIIFIEDKAYLSDFGLVLHGSTTNLSIHDKKIGPAFTIAPEMKRNPQKADPHLADAYSFAKTIWCLIKKDAKGFEGQYTSRGVESILNSGTSLPSQIEDILHKCTANIPQKRLRHSEIHTRLLDWSANSMNTEECNKQEWSNLKKRIFPHPVPESAEWLNSSNIIEVLNMIAADEYCNHTYFPDSGGLDLKGASFSPENGCIDLDLDGYPFTIRPKRLTFYSDLKDGDLDFFMLEAHELERIHKNHSNQIEVFTRFDNTYTRPECTFYNDYNGKDCPTGARIVSRVITGKFALFRKCSTYDRAEFSITFKGERLHDAYQAIHAKLPEEVFVEMIRSGSPLAKHPPCNMIYNDPTQFKKNNIKLTTQQIALINNLLKTIPKREDTSDKCEIITGSSLSLTYEEYSRRSRQETATMRFIKNLTPEERQLIVSIYYGARDSDGNFATPIDELLQDNTNDIQALRKLLEIQEESLKITLETGLAIYS